MAVMLTPALIAGGVGCLLLAPCGAAAGALLGLADFGTTLYGLVNGDLTLTDALKKLGVNLLQNLAFAGAAKLASSTYRGLKAVLKLEKGAKAAENMLDNAGLRQLALSCGGQAAAASGLSKIATRHASLVPTGDGQWALVNKATGESCPLRGTQIKDTEFGLTGISKFAAQWRLNAGAWGLWGRNVGGVRLKEGVTLTADDVKKNVVVKDGRTYIFAISISEKDLHSETAIEKILKDHGMSWDNVDELYTDRAPCKGCSSVIPSNVPISYGVIYWEGVTKARETAENLGKLLGKLRGVLSDAS
jgi:hypothetical protein